VGFEEARSTFNYQNSPAITATEQQMCKLMVTLCTVKLQVDQFSSAKELNATVLPLTITSIKYSECMFLFLRKLCGMPIASVLRRMIFPYVKCLAVSCFPTPCHKWHNFRKTYFRHKKCVLIFSTTSVRNVEQTNKCTNFC
jgi:hypothetical protein